MNKLKTSSHNDAFYQNLVEIGPVVSPLGKGRVLRLNKYESPSPKDALWEARLKLAQWFWRRFLKFLNVFSLLRNYLPLDKGRALHLLKLESLSTKDTFCHIWLKLEKKKMWKVYDTAAAGQIVIRKTHLSLRLRWADKKCTHMPKFSLGYAFDPLGQVSWKSVLTHCKSKWKY